MVIIPQNAVLRYLNFLKCCSEFCLTLKCCMKTNHTAVKNHLMSHIYLFFFKIIFRTELLARACDGASSDWHICGNESYQLVVICLLSYRRGQCPPSLSYQAVKSCTEVFSVIIETVILFFRGGKKKLATLFFPATLS